MKTLMSLFDGSGAAIDQAIKLGIEKLYSSEIDKHCVSFTDSKFPQCVQLGDVTNWREWDVDWSSVDYLVGGSPCQGFSDSGKGLNFEDPRSRLLFVFIEMRDHILSLNPDLIWFLENVEMKNTWQIRFDEIMGVERLNVKAEICSPMYRPRNYWSNFPLKQPSPKDIGLSDAIKDGFHYPASITGRKINPATGKRDDYNKDIKIVQYLEVQPHNKARCLTTVMKDCVLSALPPGRYVASELVKGVHYRYPTVSELESFLGYEGGYFSGVSDNQAKKMLGNGWSRHVTDDLMSQFVK